MPTKPKTFGPSVSRSKRQQQVADNERGTWVERYGKGWYKLRRHVIATSPLCVHCLVKGRPTQAREIDHIIPVSMGGTNDLSNLQALCLDCHSRKTASESRARRRTQMPQDKTSKATTQDTD